MLRECNGRGAWAGPERSQRWLTEFDRGPHKPSEEQAPEQVADAEENEDHECDDHGHRPDHRPDRGAVLVHSVEPRAPSPRSRSAIRETDPVTSTAPAGAHAAAAARAAASARRGLGSDVVRVAAVAPT